MPQAGTETITFKNDTSASWLFAGIEVIGGVQANVDVGTKANTSQVTASPGYTLNGTYTTVVPNQFLHNLFVNDQGGGITVGTDTVAMSAPLSVFGSGNNTYDNFSIGSALIAAASTTNTTTTVTTSTTDETAGLIQVAFRPSIVGGVAACATFLGPGEKQRRPIY